MNEEPPHLYLAATSANSVIRQPPEPPLIMFFFFLIIIINIIHTRDRVLAPCATSGLLSFYAPMLGFTAIISNLTKHHQYHSKTH